MINTNLFSQRSSEVASRFLQSAVIVDDRAYLEISPRPLRTPDRGSFRQSTRAKAPQHDPTAAMNDLNAKQLIDSFAELGIICAVLKPDLRLNDQNNKEADETAQALQNLSSRTNLATKRADIVILDWNIEHEDRPGQHAQRLIENILKTDESANSTTRIDDHSRRLRLLSIYTGDKDLGAITDEMEILLRRLNLGRIERNSYRVTAGPVTITVYGKANPTIAGADAERRIGEDKLPMRLRDDFSYMTEGLLSNTALEALSAVRINTHRILSRFNPGIDAPYVAHRAMMQPPEEAEEHPVLLIASEIEGVLADDYRIAELVGLDAMKEWLAQISLDERNLQDQLQMSAESFKAALGSLLAKGLGQTEPGIPAWESLLSKLRAYDRKAASLLTQALSVGSAGDGAKSDMEFARLTSLRSQYDAPPPILRLGSIIAEGEAAQVRYWLCVQPICDSFRIKGPRHFPFLKLTEKPADSPHPFDFVALDRETYKRLRFSRKAFDMRLIKMKPDSTTQSVKAYKRETDWLFTDAESKDLRWIADLKTDHAHRVMDQFTNEIKRVGLTESEWLRRMSLKVQSPDDLG